MLPFINFMMQMYAELVNMISLLYYMQTLYFNRFVGFL